MIKKDSNILAKHLNRVEFIKVMKASKYGWKAVEGYGQVGCPSDLYFISDADLPHPSKCIIDCKDCWEYVLKNKWK